MSVDKALLTLSTSVQALQREQSQLKWSSPALLNGINAAVTAVAKIQASFKASATFKASARFKASASAATTASLKTKAAAQTGAAALSLGVGVSAKAQAKLALGLSLNVGFSAKASLSVQLAASLSVAISALAGLKGELAKLNAAAGLVAGTGGVLPPGRRLDYGSVNRSLRSLNDNLLTCQRKADALTDGKLVSVIAAELRMSRMGAWRCDLDIDADERLDGKVRFMLDDLEFVGTVIPERSGTEGARAKCQVVAGNGHLDIRVSRSYSSPSGVQVGVVVKDILRDCGEDLSDLADEDALNITLPRWHIANMSAKDALTKVAEASNCSWRMLRDGSIWFGAETWPEVDPAGTLTRESWQDGYVELAAETPNMLPGTIYQGQKIEQVTHRYGVTLRTEIRTAGASSAFSSLFKSRQHEIDYSREYPCKVISQNADGTLMLLPDDAIMQSSGLDHVPIRYGIPGIKATISPGARCHLSFAAGDPSRPFVGSWEYDPDKVVLNSIFDGAQSLARVGDLVTSGGPGLVCTLMPLTLVGAPPNNAIAAGMPCMISFSALPATTPAQQVPLFGAVSTGIPKFQG